MTCGVCHIRTVKALGRCPADYSFWRRHGRDRTPDEVVVAFNRRMDRLLRILETPDKVA